MKLVRPEGGGRPCLVYSPFISSQDAGSEIFRALIAIIACEENDLDWVVTVGPPNPPYDGTVDEADGGSSDEADGGPDSRSDGGSRNVTSTMRYSLRPAAFGSLIQRDRYNAKSTVLELHKMTSNKGLLSGRQITAVPPCGLEVTTVSYKLNA